MTEDKSPQQKIDLNPIQIEEDTAENKGHNLKDFRVLTYLNTLEKQLIIHREKQEWKKPVRCEYLHTILFHWDEKEGQVYLNVHDQHKLKRMPIRFEAELKEDQYENFPGLYTSLTTAFIQEPSLTKEWAISKLLQKKGLLDENKTIPRNTIYAKEALMVKFPSDINRIIKLSQVITGQNEQNQIHIN